MARSILVVTPSPSLLTRQLLIGWRAPLRRMMPFWRSASLQTNTLSPERGATKWHHTKEESCLHLVSSRDVDSNIQDQSIPIVSTPFLPARPAICLYVSGVQQVSVESRGSNDDPARWEINSWGEGRGGGQDPDHALSKSSLQHVAFIECQPCRENTKHQHSRIQSAWRSAPSLLWSKGSMSVFTCMVEGHAPWHSPLEDGVKPGRSSSQLG